MKRIMGTRWGITLVVVFTGAIFLIGLINPGIGQALAQDGNISNSDSPQPSQTSEGPTCLMTPPCLDVVYADDVVRGYEWPAGVSPIAVTVDNPATGTLDYTGSTNSDSDGMVDLDLMGILDIHPGFTVTMSYGTTTRTTVVKVLTIEDVHEDTDAVEGTAVAGTQVHVLAMNNTEQKELQETADVDGHWTASFGDYVDIAAGTDIIAYQPDEDGDTTSAMWSISTPTFVVNLNLNYIWTVDWPADTLVTISVGGTSIVTDGNVGADGNYFVTYDVKPGQTVTISGGAFTKTHTTGEIGLTMVDQDNDLVVGTSLPGTEINFGYGLDVVANGSGIWIADFNTLPEDLKPGYDGYAQLEPDEDGDYTEVYWASNDDIRFPTPLEDFPAYSHLNTTDADRENNDDSKPDPSFAGCGQTVGLATVWYTFKFDEPGEISIDTMGSNYDTMLGVWTGEPGSMTRVVCNDNALSKVQSQLTFKYAADVVYYVGAAQKGASETGGDLKVSFTSFQDVPGNHNLWRYVEGFFSKGITTGCNINPMRYCPDRNVTRAEMAVFVLRSKHVDDPVAYVPVNVTPNVFADVPTTGKEWMEPWIEQFYSEGITTGCGFTSGGLRLYCPERSVNRGEMAIFMLRAVHGSSYTPPPGTGIFVDVPATNWMQPWIEQFYNEHITTGCAGSVPGVDLKYCPARNVNRAEMATFVDRAFGFPALP